MNNTKEDEIVLSVILLSYNHDMYIGKCLESIVSQKTDFKYEIIVGDDASTDKTADIILEYAKKYPELIVPVIRKKNLGAVKNLVDLLKLAKGKYIAGCEGDDYWTDENKLSIQVAFLEDNKEYIACSHDISVVNEDEILSKHQNLEWISSNRDYNIDEYKGIILPGHPVALVFRNIFKNDINADILLDIHESIADRSLAVILALRGKIYRLDRNMAAYRLNSGKGTNMTNKIYKNMGSYLVDYKINEKLEKYISDTSSKSIVYKNFRWKLFIKASAKLILYFWKSDLKSYKELFILHMSWILGIKKERL